MRLRERKGKCLELERGINTTIHHKNSSKLTRKSKRI